MIKAVELRDEAQLIASIIGGEAPTAAKNHVLKGDQDKLRIFLIAVFPPIDGAGFECHLRMLLTPYVTRHSN